ncbi:hypothetical protein Pfo_001582 [Paulownia fortunei]|nr:hypothetical protein Pfo_001582 [Paulownia fortunei]
MEAQSGAEVRRLHIVYFLSRKGRIEHPHLIRVHHLSRNGVRLRDVKRWLGELRGKEMPESFSWSYKRRYKTGYVWQDLLDDDLITPISDNEYVLKGSEISSITIEEDQKTLCKEENRSHSSETSMYVSTKSSSEIEEESPNFGSETSTLTDDSGKVEMEKSSGTAKHEEQDEKPSSNDKIESSSPFNSTLLSKKNKRRSNKVTINEKISTAAAADSSKTSSSEPHFTKAKSYSNGASHIFRNLITCGAVDTNESAVVAINKQNKPLLNMKSFDGVKDSAKNKSELRDQRAPCAAYKPANVPNCSQCGKPFKPEKLHAHMKSCKGMKALSKGAANAAISSAAAAAEKPSKGSMESQNGESVSGHLLTD